MKRHRFRLEQVLRVRRVQERLVAAELATAQQQEARAAAAVAARRASIAVRARPSGQVAVQQVLAQREVWQAELSSLDRAVADHATRRDAASAARDGWITAHRRVRALELLEERRREEHRLEAQREEANRVDDLVARRRAHEALEGAAR